MADGAGPAASEQDGHIINMCSGMILAARWAGERGACCGWAEHGPCQGQGVGRGGRGGGEALDGQDRKSVV